MPKLPDMSVTAVQKRKVMSDKAKAEAPKTPAVVVPKIRIAKPR